MNDNIERLIKLKLRAKKFVIIAVALSLLSLIERVFFITENAGTRSHMYLGLIIATILTAFTILCVLITNDLYNKYINEEIENEELRPKVIEKFRLSKDKYQEIICNDVNILNDERFRRYRSSNLEFLARIVSDSEVEIIVRYASKKDENKLKYKRNYIYLDKHYVPKRFSGDLK